MVSTKEYVEFSSWRKNNRPNWLLTKKFHIHKLSFQSNDRRYRTNHWYHVAKISSTAFLKSGRTSVVRENISYNLASFERYIVEWNNLHDSCSFNRKIPLCLLANETKDCKYSMGLLNFFHLSLIRLEFGSCFLVNIKWSMSNDHFSLRLNTLQQL